CPACSAAANAAAAKAAAVNAAALAVPLTQAPAASPLGSVIPAQASAALPPDELGQLAAALGPQTGGFPTLPVSAGLASNSTTAFLTGGGFGGAAPTGVASPDVLLGNGLSGAYLAVWFSDCGTCILLGLPLEVRVVLDYMF